MVYTREDLELVEKHVAQGERNVRQQRQIVIGLSEAGYATGEALDLLAALESNLQQLQQRRGHIRRAMLCQDAAQRPTRASLRPVVRS
jgi:hypothetical protein